MSPSMLTVFVIANSFVSCKPYLSTNPTFSCSHGECKYKPSHKSRWEGHLWSSIFGSGHSSNQDSNMAAFATFLNFLLALLPPSTILARSSLTVTLSFLELVEGATLGKKERDGEDSFWRTTTIAYPFVLLSEVL